MTCCTRCICRDRGVAKAAAVRGMVVVTMDIRTDLLGMTGGAGHARARCNRRGYCCGRYVVELAVTAVVTMTGITAVEVMQRGYLTPRADRSMADITCIAAVRLVRCAIKRHVMTRRRRMRRMTVKVRGMTC